MKQYLLSCVAVVLFGGSIAPAAAQIVSSPPVAVNSHAEVDATSLREFDTQLASDGGSVWVAVWVNNKQPGGGSEFDYDLSFQRSTDGGATWSAPQFLNTNASSDGVHKDHKPSLATDEAGTWVCVWERDNLGGVGTTDIDILYSRSTNNGATWSAPLPLNSNAATDGALADAAPVVCADTAGNWVAAWETDFAFDGTGTDRDIAFARSSDGGATWSAMALLNSNGIGDSGGDTEVEIATDNSGTWVASWLRDEQLPNPPLLPFPVRIYVAHSMDGGANWSTQKLPVPADCLSPLAVRRYDKPKPLFVGLAAWLVAYEYFGPNCNFEGSYHLVAYRRSTDGGATWVAGATNPLNVEDDFGLASDGAGNAIIASQVNEDIRAVRTTDGGATWSSSVSVNSTASTDGTIQDTFPFLASDGQGKWIAVWNSQNSSSENLIYSSASTDIGAAWSTVAAVNNFGDMRMASEDTLVDVAKAGSSLVAVWQGQYELDDSAAEDLDVYAATSSDQGETWSPATLVSDYGAADSTEASSDVNARIACDGAGNCVVVWATSFNLNGTKGTDRDILVATSSNAGLTWTAPALLNSSGLVDGSREDAEPSIATDGVGTWLVIWRNGYVRGTTVGSDSTDMTIAKSTDNGATWTAPEVFFDYANTDGALEEDVNITFGGGVWIAACSSKYREGASPGDFDILFTRSTDGVNWSATGILNSTAASDGSQVDDENIYTATDGAGKWVAVWAVEASSPGKKVLSASSEDNGVSWSTAQAVSTGNAITSTDNVRPVVATDAAGFWTCAWGSTYKPETGQFDDYDILATYSTDAGATWAPNVYLNSLADTDGSTDNHVRVAYLSGDEWISLWQSTEPVAADATRDNDIVASTFRWDFDAPNVPVLDLSASSDSGPSNSDDYTNDTTLTVTGSTNEECTVELISDIAGPIGTTTTNAGGAFTITTAALPEGVHSITAIATDLVGLTSEASVPLVVTIDTTAPAAPSVPDLVAAFDTGTSSTDNMTNLTTLDFTGTREANTSVALTSTAAGTFGTAALGSGAWTVTGSGLAANVTHNVRARATDLAGNVGPQSSALPVVVDTVGPSVTVRNPASGAIVGGLATVQVTFGEAVTGITGANLTVNGSPAVNGLGSGVGPYTFSGYATPTDGTVTVNLLAGSATDAAGNAILPDSWTYTKDTSFPTITWTATNVTDGGVTNGTPAPLQLTANFSEPVSGFVLGDFSNTNVNLGSFTTINASTYRVTLTQPAGNPQGLATISIGAGAATATAAPAGRNSLASPTFSFTWDTIRPSVTGFTISNSSPTSEDTIVCQVQFSGPVTDFDDAADVLHTTDGNVAYTSVEIIAVSSSNYTVEFNGVTGDGSFSPFVSANAVRDAANNGNLLGPLSPSSIIIDNTAPFVSVDALVTEDNRPALSGTVGSAGMDADIPVTVTVNGQSNPATVTGNTWALSDDILLPLNDGIYNVSATATDEAGNLGADSTTGELTVDTLAPVITLTGSTLVSVNCTDGYIDEGYSAFDIVDGNVTANVVVTGEVTPLTPVGMHTITYSVTDSGGHTATAVRVVEVADNCPLGLTVVSPETTFEVNAGEEVTLEIEVLAPTGPYTVQWYRVEGTKADTPVGDGDETLTLTNLSAIDDADYYAIVSDAVTDITSPIFTVHVNLGLPVGGLGSIAAAAALLSLSGAWMSRRKKR